jgi:hypothetical protein
LLPFPRNDCKYFCPFYHTNNKFKASPIIKAAPFPSLVGEGQGGVQRRGLPEGFGVADSLRGEAILRYEIEKSKK